MELSQTQHIGATQVIDTVSRSSSISRSFSNAPEIAAGSALKSKSKHFLPSSSVYPMSQSQSSTSGIETQMLIDLALDSGPVQGTNDTEMLGILLLFASWVRIA